MNWTNSKHRYSSASIALHWAMVILVVGAYATAELREAFAEGSTQQIMLTSAHAMTGLAVFVLVFARLALRAGPKPSITPAPSRVQAGFATAMHLTLYVFMIAMPLLGWLLVSAEGTFVLPGGFHLPALVSPDRQLAETAGEIHEIVGTIGYGLVGAHALAALFHHYLIRDDTLVRMLPRRRRH